MKLLSKGVSVWATTSSHFKINELQSLGIQAFHIDFSQEKSLLPRLDDQLFDAVIITIPPGGREVLQSIALHQKIADWTCGLETEQIIYCSSTSVYEKEEGELVEEDANPNGLIGRLEQVYRTINKRTAILRFGGLIGKDRNPVVYLAKKEKFEKPMGFVNFTTIYEAMDAIELVLQQKLSETYNVVNTDHPIRYEYYSAEAARRGLTLPIADTTDVSQGKLISSAFFERTTGYKFKPMASQDL